ncbi:unnamed protein product [Clonostachys rhizophaga]|uniref:Uncharacterized protein n=1 Tax=Clonostachys rhizophaga TaxID=160324 RepID=A0A9N9V189_9HYPO|nr:unnamed protein product [Clonostachys rhizophaga]
MQHEGTTKPRERNPHIRQLQQNKELIRVPDHKGPLGVPPAGDEPPAGVQLRQRPARLDVGVLGPREAGGDVGDNTGGSRGPAAPAPAVGGDELAQQRGKHGEEVGEDRPSDEGEPVEGDDGLLEESVGGRARELHVSEGVGPEELGGRGEEQPAHVVEGDGDDEADGAVAAAVGDEGPAQGGDGVHPRHVCYEGVPRLRELVQGRSISAVVFGGDAAAVGFAAAFPVDQDSSLSHEDSWVAGHSGWPRLECLQSFLCAIGARSNLEEKFHVSQYHMGGKKRDGHRGLYTP